MIRTVTLLRDFFPQGEYLPRTLDQVHAEETIDLHDHRAAARWPITTVRAPTKPTTIRRSRRSRARWASRRCPPPPRCSTRFPVAPAKTEFWSFVIPQQHEEQGAGVEPGPRASNKADTLRGAINGNGPVRPSTYSDPRLRAMILRRRRGVCPQGRARAAARLGQCGPRRGHLPRGARARAGRRQVAAGGDGERRPARPAAAAEVSARAPGALPSARGRAKMGDEPAQADPQRRPRRGAISTRASASATSRRCGRCCTA